MTEKQFFFKKNIQDIEIKMLRIKNDCYIKIIPSCQKSDAKKIIIMINGEKRQFDIYDENGRESLRIYLKGKKIEPNFYLLDNKVNYKILCLKNGIDIKKIPLAEINKDKLIKFSNCISRDISCWAVNIYMTSRKEKQPFCNM